MNLLQHALDLKDKLLALLKLKVAVVESTNLNRRVSL